MSISLETSCALENFSVASIIVLFVIIVNSE